MQQIVKVFVGRRAFSLIINAKGLRNGMFVHGFVSMT